MYFQFKLKLNLELVDELETVLLPLHFNMKDSDVFTYNYRGYQEY